MISRKGAQRTNQEEQINSLPLCGLLAALRETSLRPYNKNS